VKNIVDFFQIAEKLECEYRLTRMSDGKKQAVASHSWNMALMAMVFAPYLKNSVDMERVLKICLLHDLPEAIAHDVPLHEQTDEVRTRKQADEKNAIDMISGLLNNSDFRSCFNEYEERLTPEARLVKALDVMDTAVQHMSAQDLAYVGEYADCFYWKMFFKDDFAAFFDFEPVLRGVFDEIKSRVAKRLKLELNINTGDFV
jgi:putative hydrolase of HD superfamily